MASGFSFFLSIPQSGLFCLIFWGRENHGGSPLFRLGNALMRKSLVSDRLRTFGSLQRILISPVRVIVELGDSFLK